MSGARLKAVLKLLVICLVLTPGWWLRGDVVDKPSLIVVISVDQLRPDRISSEFPGGLGKLMREGRVFSRAQLDHAITNTCPGHAVMLTGMNPAKTGISGNEFIDRQDWEARYCVADEDQKHQVIGGKTNRSPAYLSVDTLGDWLKGNDPGTRVFAIGGKDRAVITMAGHSADGVYWYDREQVKFTSSRYYEQALPDFVTDFNGTDGSTGFRQRLPERWEHGAGRFRQDDYPGESTKFGNISGHPLTVGDSDDVGEQIYTSPYVDIASIELAMRVAEEQALGRRQGTDLLVLALSATDTVGHQYGPFSAESDDTIAKIDEHLGLFFSFLDDKIGSEAYTVVLSADHGVVELPEWLKADGRLACPLADGRINVIPFVLEMTWHVYKNFTFPFGNPTSLVKFAGSQISINHTYATNHGIEVDAVVASLKEFLEGKEFVKTVWTPAAFMADSSATAALFRNSYVPGKSGDLFIQPMETCVFRSDGTGHGTPYDYDRNIPLLFAGKGVSQGVDTSVAHSVDIAPTLANLLGLTVPAELDGRVLLVQEPVR